jgi:cytosine/adenosine deaminase-related metal-dependent hydrolase
VALRRGHPDPMAPQIVAAARDAIVQARASGTGLVGDISNTLVTIALLREAKMPGRVFHEVLGFNLPDPAAAVRAGCERLAAVAPDESVRANVTPHAPYSVSPAMFSELERVLGGVADAVTSVHLGESPEEVEFLRTGEGGIRTALERIGAWDASWQAPGCGPVEYMDRFGLVTPRMLADPDVARFYQSGVRVAIGTDSLASVEDLNLFAEMARIRTLAPHVPASAVLESATRIGAEALGFGADFGTIEPGKRAALIAVRVPEGVADVEEYVLSGIEPDDVRWLHGETGEPAIR